MSHHAYPKNDTGFGAAMANAPRVGDPLLERMAAVPARTEPVPVA